MEPLAPREIEYAILKVVYADRQQPSLFPHWCEAVQTHRLGQLTDWGKVVSALKGLHTTGFIVLQKVYGSPYTGEEGDDAFFYSGSGFRALQTEKGSRHWDQIRDS